MTTTKSSHILLVEDDEFFRDLIFANLTQHQYHVTRVSDGKEAQLELSKNTYDLILTDVLTPNLSGLELLAWLRQTQPNAKIILMSGYAEEILLNHNVIDENLKFLAKPFTCSDLLNIISVILNK